MNYSSHPVSSWAPMAQSMYTRPEPIQSSQSVAIRFVYTCREQGSTLALCSLVSFFRSRYDGYELEMLQNPKNGKVAIGKEKGR